MKLIMAIINNSDVKEVTRAMMNGGFYVTKIGASGGFMSSGVTTIISAVSDEKKNAALAILKVSTHSHKYKTTEKMIDNKALASEKAEEIVVGGATVFVLNVEENYKY